MVVGCQCQCISHTRRGRSQHTPPEVVKHMFKEASRGKNYMNAADLALFLENVQGEKGVNEQKAVSLITQTVLSAIAGFHFSISIASVELDLFGFSNYLINTKLNPPIVPTPTATHDMTKPLSHYYMYSSHNSYLTGNQLTSNSSVAPIAEALQNGCRVIELDCWERGDRIMVLHGNTLTKPVSFKDCLIAIKENAFLTSNYPVIITIENHLGTELQKKAAIVLRETLGDCLFYPTEEQRPPIAFESPEALKGFIIISDQPPADTVEDQLAVDPDAARNLAEDDMDDASTSSTLHARHAQKLRKHINRTHKKALLKVANTAAKVLRKSIMGKQIEVKETIEFQELIYIICAKPSDMKEKQVHGGPLVGGEQAIMANLSEPQLQNLINNHPDSIIEYSKKNLGRVYPFGLRFDSSNADPMLAWSHGFQIAAINLQGRDRPVWLAQGFFQMNGNTGYIKKPNIFLPSSALSHEEILNLPPRVILKIAIHGIKSDEDKKQTNIIYNCNEPHWENEHFEFPIRVPEIAMLRLECWEWDMGNDDFVGQACIPIREMRYGIRSVALRSRSGILKSSKLLCHFQSYVVSSEHIIPISEEEIL